MKKLLLSVAVFLFTAQVFCQSPNRTTRRFNTEYYSQKSKKQKTTAWILLGGGTTLVITGFVVASAQNYFFPGFAFVGLGGLVMISSVPFFNSAVKNKERAISVSFIRGKIPVIRKGSFVTQSYPALSIKIKLR